MRRPPALPPALPLGLIACLALALPAAADDDMSLPADDAAHDFRPLPLPEAAAIVAGRYEGRLIAARLAPPRPRERDLGAELVEELRLLTATGAVLNIRLDARSGRFLDIAGVGQTEARR